MSKTHLYNLTLWRQIFFFGYFEYWIQTYYFLWFFFIPYIIIYFLLFPFVSCYGKSWNTLSKTLFKYDVLLTSFRRNFSHFPSSSNIAVWTFSMHCIVLHKAERDDSKLKTSHKVNDNVTSLWQSTRLIEKPWRAINFLSWFGICNVLNSPVPRSNFSPLAPGREVRRWNIAFPREGGARLEDGVFLPWACWKLEINIFISRVIYLTPARNSGNRKLAFFSSAQKLLSRALCCY